MSLNRFALFWALLLAGFAFPGDRALAQEVVHFSGKEELGTIVVRVSERRLYFILGEGRALRYPVGVGRSGKQWFGSTYIVSKRIRPAWSPPVEIRGNRPAWVIPAGAPNNPMGAAALVLADNELAIHGTNNPGSIGGFVSWGCVRMNNQHIMDLYNRVSVSTRVVFADPPRREIAKPATQPPSSMAQGIVASVKPATVRKDEGPETTKEMQAVAAPTYSLPASLPEPSKTQPSSPAPLDIFN